MEPEEVKAARAALGLTRRQLATALQLAPSYGRDTVRHWERGKREPSGPAQVAIRLMVDRQNGESR